MVEKLIKKYKTKLKVLDFVYMEKLLDDMSDEQFQKLESRYEKIYAVFAEIISDLELREDFKPLKEIRNHFTNWYNSRKVNGKKVAVVAELSDYQKGFQQQRDEYKNKFK